MSGADQQKLKVFLSYSRRDATAFSEELVLALNACGFEAFLDRRDIAPGDPWEERLQRLIEAADTVVYMVSPRSIVSDRCHWEIAKAGELGKRILPVIAQAVPDSDMPAELKRLQYIPFTEGNPFGVALAGLAGALRTDVEWIREHTRLGELAARWHDRSRHEALLLRGNEIDEAKAWVARRPRNAPEPTLLQREFIDQSERVETERSRREEAQEERARNLRRVIAASLAALTIMVILSVIAARGWWLAQSRGIELKAQTDLAFTQRDKAQRAKEDAELQSKTAQEQSQAAYNASKALTTFVQLLKSVVEKVEMERRPSAATPGPSSGWLGVQVDKVPLEPAITSQFPVPFGVVVKTIEPASPASAAEVKTFDVIYQINSRLVLNTEIYFDVMAQLRPGDDVSLDILRGGETRQVKLKLAAQRAKPVDVEVRLPVRPPEVALDADPSAAGGHGTILVSIHDTDNPVTIVSVFVSAEGKPEVKVMPRELPLPDSYTSPRAGFTPMSYQIPLYEGGNTVRVVAVNEIGESEPRTATINHTGEGALDKRGVLRVLAIGVDKYPGASKVFRDLKYAGADAAAFAETAVKRMGPLHEKSAVTLLVNGGKDGEPTKANIEAALVKLEREARDNDTVVLFYAGQGESWTDGNYHVMATDLVRESSKQPGVNFVDWTTIQGTVTRAKGRRLIFVDACRIGSVDKCYNVKLTADALTDRFVAFSATSSNQSAWELGEKHGTFTSVLIAGLDKAIDPKQQAVTVYRLGSYVNEEVAGRTGGKQTPEYVSGQGNFALAR